MTNKKLWLSLLIVVLIVCMLSVTLMSCKKTEPKKTVKEPTTEEKAIEAIVAGIKASVENGDMTDLKVDGTLGLTVGDKKYELKLALELDLLQFTGYNYEAASGEFDEKGEYFTKSGSEYSKVDSPKLADFTANKYYIRVSRTGVEHADTSNTKITAELKDVSTSTASTLLGVYYWDAAPNVDQNPTNVDPYEGNVLYVQAKSGDTQKKIKFPAPNVAKLQDLLDGQVNFSGIDLGDEDVWGSLDQYLGIVASLATDGVCTDTEASITLNIGTLLDPNNANNLLALVSGLQDWLTALDLDINASALGDLLPNISLVLSADLDDGVATGFDISLKLSEKDMVIKNKTADHTVINVNMTKDVEVAISLDYEIGKCTPFYPSDLTTAYVAQQNILDVVISADITLDSALGASFNLNGKSLSIAVPAGSYTLTAEIAADPWVVIANLKDISFDQGTAKLLDSIKTILGCVESLHLNLHDKVNDTDAINLVLANQYMAGEKQIDTTTKLPIKYATISTTVLTGLDNTTLDINGVIDLVLGFIEKSGKAKPDSVLTDSKYAPAPSTDDADDKTTKLLQTIGKYLLGAYIGINDSNGIIYASFNSALTEYKVIPFGGYTKWTGDYNSAFSYYTLKAGTNAYKLRTTEAFDATKKYYTLVEKHFDEVDQSKTTFDAMRQYYTYNTSEHKYEPVGDSVKAFDTSKTYYVFVDDKYVEAEGITAFADGTDYYYWVDADYAPYTYEASTWSSADHYVKGLSDGGDFGLGLNAYLKINKNTTTKKLEIEIDATMTNLDIFGLPKSVHATINNFNIEFFNNDFLVYNGGNTAAHIARYSTIGD